MSSKMKREIVSVEIEDTWPVERRASGNFSTGFVIFVQSMEMRTSLVTVKNG